MCVCAPCTNNENIKLFANMKIKQTNLTCNTKNIQGNNPLGVGNRFCSFRQHLPTLLQTWIIWGTALKPTNVLMEKVEIKKLATLP